MKFTDLTLKPEILTTLAQEGFINPTPIQEKIVPMAMKNKNICGRSPTGSGKTHAFLLPILQKVDVESNKVQALILAPTRELAKQIFEMCKPFAKNMEGLRVQLLSSGSDRNRDINSVNNTPHIVIGTPGRITDIAFTAAKLNITTATICVIDEADMILEAGFLDEVGLILSKMKPSTQVLAFSASLPENLLQFLQKYLKKPEYVNLAQQSITAANVTHIAYPTRNRDRLMVLKQLINAINPYIVLIFASKKENVEKIYQDLKENGYNCGMIHGDLNSTVRRTTMKRIRNNEFTIVVASDIAARGIDIEGVSQVINYDLPYEEDFYFHRAGRTGRNGNEGICYTLYDKDEMFKLQSLKKRGVNFKNQEYRDGNWVDLKPLFQPVRRNKPNPLNDEIRKVVKQNAKNKVKPNYKKKVKQEIAKLKQKHKREIIKKDIERQKKERYIKNSKEANS